MKPLFKITTPNGKYKIEGHYHPKSWGVWDKIVDKYKSSNGVLKIKACYFFSVTEEIAKSWGYERNGYTAKEWLKYRIAADYGIKDLSNILLILIEE